MDFFYLHLNPSMVKKQTLDGSDPVGDLILLQTLSTFRGVDMAEYLVSEPVIQDTHPQTQYDLIANICHEGEPGKGNLKSLASFLYTLLWPLRAV